MERIVNIGQYRASRPWENAENLPTDSPEGSGRAGAQRRRGILLHFPEPTQGPLFAAAIAAVGVLGLLMSAVRI